MSTPILLTGGTISFSHTFILVLVASLVTIALRAFPFVLFGGDRQMPAFVQKIANLMPPAIIAVLVVYCLKGSMVTVTMESLSAAIAVVVVVAVHLWKRSVLFSIAAGTIVYMVCLHVIV